QGTHVNLGDVFGSGPILCLGLRLDPIDAAKFEEIIDVQIAEKGLQSVEDFGDRYAERLGSFTVHVGVQSRRTHAEAGPNGPDGRFLSGLGEELLIDSGKLVEVAAAGVLQLHRKASRGTESPDGRCVEGQ